MQLSDLFVSHKQVKPVSFTIKTPSLPQPIYLNRERAQAITSEIKPEDTSIWKTEGPLNWKVANADVVTTPVQTTPSSSIPKVESASLQSDKHWENPYTGKPELWLKEMTAAYKRAGLSDNAIRNLITKNALESGRGSHAQGAYNFGNITPGSKWKGAIVHGHDSNAEGKAISQQFRSYPNLASYVEDEIKFLTSLYDFNQDDDFDTFSQKLQGGNKGGLKYAEANSYIGALKGVYNSIYG